MTAPATPPTAAYASALRALQRQQRARLTTLIQQTESALHRDWQAGPALAAQLYRPVLDEYARALADLRLSQDDPAAHLAVSWLNEQNVQLKSIEASVQASMTNYAGQAARTVEEAQNAALARGLQDASSLTQEALFPASRLGVNPDVLFSRPNPDALALWAGRAGNGHPLGDLFANFPAEATSEARKAMLFGLATGANPKAMASGIANAMGISRSRAIIISRTEALTAYRAAAHETYRANADVLAGWLWSAGGNNPCFPAGTMILTRRGQRPIEDVRVGDEVWTRHHRFRRITGVMQRQYTGLLVTITTDARTVVATAEHPFLFDNYGQHDWVEAKDLTTSDRVVCVDSTWLREREMPIRHLECNHQATGVAVYNLEVQDDQSYVANGFIVHNCAMCMGMDGTFHGLWEDLSDHPCGKCSPLPVTKDWSEIFANHGFGDIDTSELGDTRITRSYVSGEERFRQMSAAQQERIIGTRTGYEAYKRGELELRDFTGVKPPENGFPAQYYQKSLKELQIPTRQGRLVEPSPTIAGAHRAVERGRITPLEQMPKWARQSPARENVYQILRNGLPYNMTEHERPLLLMNLEQMLAETDLPANVRAAAEKLYEAMRAEEQRLATGVWHSVPGGGRAYAPARKAVQATGLAAHEVQATSTRTVMSAAEVEAKAELKAARSQVTSLARKLDKATTAGKDTTTLTRDLAGAQERLATAQVKVDAEVAARKAAQAAAKAAEKEARAAERAVAREAAKQAKAAEREAAKAAKDAVATTTTRNGKMTYAEFKAAYERGTAPEGNIGAAYQLVMEHPNFARRLTAEKGIVREIPTTRAPVTRAAKVSDGLNTYAKWKAAYEKAEARFIQDGRESGYAILAKDHPRFAARLIAERAAAQDATAAENAALDVAFARSRATEATREATASYDLTASDKRFAADLKRQIADLDQHSLTHDQALDIGGQINSRITHDPTMAVYQQAAEDVQAIRQSIDAGGFSSLSHEQIQWLANDPAAVAAHGGVHYDGAIAQYKAEYQARALSYLQEVRELGGADLRLDATSEAFDREVAQSLEAVQQQLPRDWIGASNNYGDLAVERNLTANSGGYYQPSMGRDGNATLALSVGPGSSPIDVQSLALHEMMHRMEDVLPQIGELERAFYASRTAGEAFTDLTNGIIGKTKLDDWADQYLGRAPIISRGPTYLNANGLEVGYRESYELLSMGAEALLGGGSTYDLILLREDEDFMNFVLGLLAIVRADAGVGALIP